jgi:hypothetical protein
MRIEKDLEIGRHILHIAERLGKKAVRSFEVQIKKAPRLLMDDGFDAFRSTRRMH